MNLPFKVPGWYDPDKNMTRSLDWGQYDVFEAWDLITGEVIPVSYTHLDVYKRQIVSLSRGDFKLSGIFSEYSSTRGCYTTSTETLRLVDFKKI